MNGIIFGCFDILHYGHIRAIKYCIDNCDHLTIGLFTCKAIQEYKNKPFIPYQIRKNTLKEIFPFVEIIPIVHRHWSSVVIDDYDIVFVSDTYKGCPPKMVHSLASVNLVYIKHTDGVSSTKIKERIRNGN
jgi:glycerol-3-phosphate cytidylyltransferase